MKEFCVDFNAPLCDYDSEEQTYGCRQTNPNICGSNGIEGICAFDSKDHICKHPSKASEKQFNKLKNG